MSRKGEMDGLYGLYLENDEKLAIAYMLTSPQDHETVFRQLMPHDFYFIRHAMIWQAAAMIWDRGQVPDVTSVVQALEQSGDPMAQVVNNGDYVHRLIADRSVQASPAAAIVRLLRASRERGSGR